MKTSILIVLTLSTLTGCFSQQKPDKSFDVSVKDPAFVDSHPRVMFDEAHFNMHTSSGTYLPFVNLIKNDGCSVTPNKASFTKESLERVDLLIISNAKGGKHDFKELPAFTDGECNAVQNWVEAGGSLLLIADHHPMGSAAENLSMRFGVHMFDGETGDSIYYEGSEAFRDKLIFSTLNGVLPDNEITRGRNADEIVNKVVTDRGQSLSIPDDAMVLLPLSEHAFHFVPDSIWHEGTKTFTRFQGPFSAKGNCQGLAMRFGKGRVVILGEAAMLTAQTYKGEKFGMNSGQNDNKQFALNIVRWLCATD